jgi:hypothetical protein
MAQKQIIKDSYMMKFIRTGVGDEQNLINDLKTKNKSSHYFKIFGKYDVLEITRLDQLHNALRAHADNRIRSISSFPFFCWHNITLDFEKSLKKSVSPAVSLLKLQDIVFQERGLDGIKHVIMELKKKNRGFHVLVGMGYYEIFVWLPSADIQSVFNVARKVRDYKIGAFFPDFPPKHINKPLFADTTTIPVISYQNVINKSKWNKLTGEVSPFVKVKCSPGLENVVAQKWKGQWHPLLGSEDLVCFWDKPVSLSQFVKELFENRKEWGETAGVFDTSTKIHGDKYVVPKGVHETVTRHKTEDHLGIVLTKLSQKNNINQFLISELINITSLINTHIGSNIEISKTYYDIMASTTFLGLLLCEYSSALDSKDIRYAAEIEHQLFAYVSCIHTAMHQHFPSKDYTEFSDSSNGVPYSGSLSRIIRAISVLPEQLLGIISQMSPPDPLVKAIASATEGKRKKFLEVTLEDYATPWKGFVFLHLAEGYQLLNQGEIIIVPYKDIFQILNWQTMTHEISHAYYARIEFEEIERVWYEEWSRHAISVSETSGIDVNLRNTTNELFAHWFDFRHFYAGELDFYIWSIWRTWLSVSRIYDHPIDYWHRTLFVRIATQYKSLAPKMSSIRKSAKTALDQTTELCTLFEPELKYIEDYLKIKFPKKYKDFKLNAESRKAVLALMVITHDLLYILEVKGYYSKELVKALHDEDEVLSKVVENVISGKILTTTIANPYILLHKILKHSFEKNTIPTDPITIAAIFTLWEASRSFARIPNSCAQNICATV